MCTNFQAKQTALTFLAQICPKMELGLEIQKTNIGIKSASLRYYVYQFSDKMDNFDFLGPNLPKNGFWGWNFKNISLDSESTPRIYHVCQFSVKMDNF